MSKGGWKPVMARQDFVPGAENRFDSLDWVWNRLGSPTKVHQLLVRSKPLFDLLWPVGQHYSSPLNPVFICTVQDLNVLSTRRTWLARDGFLPLSWFFFQNPKPLEFDFRILIDSDLVDLVPKAWKNHIGVYQIANADPTDGSLAKSLNRQIVLGLVNECFFDQSEMEHHLSFMNEMPTDCMLFDRYNPFSSRHKQEYFAQYCFQLSRCLKTTKLKAIDWSEVEQASDLKNCGIVELNNKWIYSDSLMIHTCLQKGAQLLKSPSPILNLGKWVPLSPYHGIRCSTEVKSRFLWDPIQKEANRSLPFLSSNLPQPAESAGLPWPSWFDQYARLLWKEFQLNKKNLKKDNPRASRSLEANA